MQILNQWLEQLTYTPGQCKRPSYYLRLRFYQNLAITGQVLFVRILFVKMIVYAYPAYIGDPASISSCTV